MEATEEVGVAVLEVGGEPVQAATTVRGVKMQRGRKAVGRTVGTPQVIKATVSALAADAAKWATEEYQRSNDKLYALIQRCYALYHDVVRGDAKDVKANKEALHKWMTDNGLGEYVDKELPQKIIRCVFGTRDRRRVSAYTIALRRVIAERCKVVDVPAKIAEFGGVHEMTLKRNPSALTTAQKVGQAKAHLAASNLGTVKSAALDNSFEADKVGDDFAAVLELQADGSYTVKCVVGSAGAVNAAFAAVHSKYKEEIAAQTQAKAAQAASDAKDEAIKRAIAA